MAPVSAVSSASGQWPESGSTDCQTTALQDPLFDLKGGCEHLGPSALGCKFAVNSLANPQVWVCVVVLGSGTQFDRLRIDFDGTGASLAAGLVLAFVSASRYGAARATGFQVQLPGITLGRIRVGFQSSQLSRSACSTSIITSCSGAARRVCRSWSYVGRTATTRWQLRGYACV